MEQASFIVRFYFSKYLRFSPRGMDRFDSSLFDSIIQPHHLMDNEEAKEEEKKDNENNVRLSARYSNSLFII